MRIQRHGIILNTGRYEECVAFYRGVFDLPVMFDISDADSSLTCLAFGDSYLMIEKGGTASEGGKAAAHCPHKLRFNVADLQQALGKLRAFGIPAEIQVHGWGSTIDIHDPDGNRIGIRDEAGFRAQEDACP